MFSDFLEEGKAKSAIIDKEKIKSLMNTSDDYLLSLSRIDFDEYNSSMLVSSHYDALRMIVEAISIKNGYNIYSHEAFTCFIDEILKKDILAKKFDRMRKIRNGISYYGNRLDKEDAEAICEEIIILIKDFRKLLQIPS